MRSAKRSSLRGFIERPISEAAQNRPLCATVLNQLVLSQTTFARGLLFGNNFEERLAKYEALPRSRFGGLRRSMKARSWGFLSTLLLTVVLWPDQELTASTYYTPPVCEAFNLAKAVFIGRVVNASLKREYVYGDEGDEPSVSCSNELVFDVIESFSGASGRLITVWESGHETCEGLDLTPGEVYLVYAYEDEDEGGDKRLWAGV